MQKKFNITFEVDVDYSNYEDGHIDLYNKVLNSIKDDPKLLKQILENAILFEVEQFCEYSVRKGDVKDVEAIKMAISKLSNVERDYFDVAEKNGVFSYVTEFVTDAIIVESMDMRIEEIAD